MLSVGKLKYIKTHLLLRSHKLVIIQAAKMLRLGFATLLMMAATTAAMNINHVYHKEGETRE